MYTYVTVYMFPSPPSACSPHCPAICRLVYALDCPRGVSALVAFRASLSLSYSSVYVLILYVCHRLYDLSVCLVVSLASFCRYYLFCSFPMSVNACMLYLGAYYMLPYVLPRPVLVVSMASLCLYYFVCLCFLVPGMCTMVPGLCVYCGLVPCVRIFCTRFADHRLCGALSGLVSMLADPCCASLSLVGLFWERDPCVFVWVSSLSRVSFLRLGVWRSKCDKVSRTTGQSGRGA